MPKRKRDSQHTCLTLSKDALGVVVQYLDNFEEALVVGEELNLPHITIYATFCPQSNEAIKQMQTRCRFKTVNLEFNSQFTDVSALRTCNTVDLGWNSKVTDVSALRTCHTVHLGCNSKLTDVSALGTCHTVYLGLNSKVTDVSALGTCHTVYLGGYSKVTDVSALGTCHTVYLGWYSKVAEDQQQYLISCGVTLKI